MSKEDWGLVTLPTSGDPEKIAIGRLKAASDMALKYYGTPLVVTTSGGKDSSVCVELALRGCPMASKKRYAEFRRWPAYEKLYIQAFDRMLDERRKRGKMDGNWMMGGTGQEVFRWWMEEDVLPGQISIEELT